MYAQGVPEVTASNIASIWEYCSMLVKMPADSMVIFWMHATPHYMKPESYIMPIQKTSHETEYSESR